MSFKDSKATRAWNSRHKAKEEWVSAIADRLELNASLSEAAEAKEHFPTYQELWTGVSLFGGSIEEDARQLQRLLAYEDQDSTLGAREALQTFLLRPNKLTARAIVNASGRSQDTQNRARFYAAVLGDLHISEDVHVAHWQPCDEALLTVIAEGICRAFHDNFKSHDGGGGWRDVALHIGMSAIDAAAKHAQHVEAALAEVVERREQAETLARISEQDSERPVEEVSFDDPVEAALYEEEFGHIKPGSQEEYLETPEGKDAIHAGLKERLAQIFARGRIPTKLVLHKLEKIASTSDRAGFMRMFADISGNELPMCVAEYPHALMHELIGAWPHAVDVIQQIFRDIKSGEALRLPPVLLVGAPGSGKTSLLTEIVRVLSMPSIVYPCATVSDSSFGGTSLQWSSRRSSVPLDLIRQSKIANPAVILDEIEKSGTSNHNGSLVYSLLPMLEAHTAKAYYEVGLEVPSDLSAVSFLATANSLDLPAPLKDRFRVLVMPDAGPEHVQVLSRRMIQQIAIARGLDPGWIQPLDQDEIEVIQATWGGGSLRKLKLAIEATINTRDQHRSVN